MKNREIKVYGCYYPKDRMRRVKIARLSDGSVHIRFYRRSRAKVKQTALIETRGQRVCTTIRLADETFRALMDLYVRMSHDEYVERIIENGP